MARRTMEHTRVRRRMSGGPLKAATERTHTPIPAEILSSERTAPDGPRAKSSSVALETYQTLAASLADALTEIERLTSALQTLTEERDKLLTDWRAQDLILQEIASFAGDEHVTCAADVLPAVKAHVSELTAALQDEKVWSDMLGKGTSPCGHWKAHAVLMDPKGAHIDCLDCQVERLTAALQQAHQQIDGFYRGNTRPEKPSCERFLRLAHAGPSDVCATCGHHEHQHGVPLQQAHQWQPIETAPKDTDVLVVTRGVIFCATDYTSHDPEAAGWHFAGVPESSADWPDPTHWMPLPPLPDLGERKT